MDRDDKGRKKEIKLTKREVREYGFDLEGVAYCWHCESEILVRDVVDNFYGDWCPVPGCDGGGWGVDLFDEPWWEGSKVEHQA